MPVETLSPSPSAPAIKNGASSLPREETSTLKIEVARILIVRGGLRPELSCLEEILREGGFPKACLVSHRRLNGPWIEEFEPDLIIADLACPQTDGREVLQKIQQRLPSRNFRPMIALTAGGNTAMRRLARAGGAQEFLSEPLEPTEVLLRIQNVLQTRSFEHSFHAGQKQQDETLSRRAEELETTLTRLKADQQTLIQTERLRALGLMAEGVAHDFNNSLACVLGYTELILRDPSQLQQQEKVTGYLQRINTAASDAARLVDRLREFSRPNENREQFQPVNLNELIEETLSRNRAGWESEAQKKGLNLQIKVQSEPVPCIDAHPAELRELLTHLLVNAMDAMPGGGQITLKTRQAGGVVELEILDSGKGMTEEVRLHCLEPFYTTKGARGSGLGLAMVYGIVQRHAGNIEVRSEPGLGTYLRLRFPVGTRSSDLQTSSESPCRRPLQVLVVDDQPDLCDLVREYLAQDWHRVETATSGLEALEKFRREKFDMVITDKTMPGMDGEQLAAAMKQIRPTQTIILLTGFNEWAESGHASPAVDLVLSKPISLSALRTAVLELVAS